MFVNNSYKSAEPYKGTSILTIKELLGTRSSSLFVFISLVFCK